MSSTSVNCCDVTVVCTIIGGFVTNFIFLDRYNHFDKPIGLWVEVNFILLLVSYFVLRGRQSFETQNESTLARAFLLILTLIWSTYGTLWVVRSHPESILLLAFGLLNVNYLLILCLILSILEHTVMDYFKRERQRIDEENRLNTVALLNEAIEELERDSLTEEQIERLPRALITAEQITSLEETMCSICLDNLIVGSDAITLPACGHRFHSECAILWLRKKAVCPYDKTPIITNEDPMENEGVSPSIENQAVSIGAGN